MKTDKKICPVLKTAALLSDMWTMLIIRDLLTGPKRFSDFEKSLKSISTRTLALKLTKLANDAMLTKRDDGVYIITQKGMGIQKVERAMRNYGRKYL